MILEIIIISIIGTVLHFTYELSNHNKIVGLFSAVNESVWEHVKIALTPTILLSTIEILIYRGNPNYILAKFLCLLTIIILMPLLFYSYKIFTKKHILILDIICFYLVIIVSQIIFQKILNLDNLGFVLQYISTIGIFIIFGLYMILTLMPIKNFLFKDPITNKYGLDGH